MSFHVPHRHRVRSGPFGSSNDAGNNGAFFIPLKAGHAPIKIIASDGAGWEHVSASLPNRCPTWLEMSAIKSIFWDSDDCVVQFHPPKNEYVNNHPFCLHLWRSTQYAFPLPDSLLVGLKDFTPAQIQAMTNEQRVKLIDIANDAVGAAA